MSNASLVHDGTGVVKIPDSMLENGPPFQDQMVGTPLEQLGECASRICYDSFGMDPETGKRRGRSSEQLHTHILDVINLSVYEHSNFTFGFKIHPVNAGSFGNYVIPFLNRKGIWVENPQPFVIEVTTNLRAILEWDRWLHGINITGPSSALKGLMKYWGNQLAPQIIREIEYSDDGNIAKLIDNSWLKPAKDLIEHQAWITLWLMGSRGFTHEMVRHRFAMSQRSTRYVDEAQSQYIVHPLIKKYLDNVDDDKRRMTERIMLNAVDADRTAYTHLVNELAEFCARQGMDKPTAKKQGRGAARGNLGNALASEMVFSAPVIGWKWILNQRLSKFADAEIRAVFEDALPALKQSQYGHFFEDHDSIPSPDGMGRILQLT